MNGYMGKMLFVNLSDGTFEEETFDKEYARKYVGAYGFGAEVMLRRMPAYADPLGPDNMLGFTTGAVNATPALFGGRYMSVCKSPITNGWSDASGGGSLGPTLKRSGFDALFINGISEKPVYLVIDDGKYEIKDASDLWGKDSRETTVLLKEKYGKNASVAAIGKAGEEQLKLACIMNDDMSAAARGGHGAVMGSKKLKAVVIKGTQSVEIGDKEKLMAWNQGIAACISNPPEQLAGIINAFKMFGTGTITKNCILNGDASVKNFSGSVVDLTDEEIDIFGVDKMQKDWYVKSEGCAQCPLRCKARLNVKNSRWPLGEVERPQYDSYVAFGVNCMNGDIDAVQACNEYCNQTGMDTMSAGAVISWVFECYEHGVLTKEDLDGIKAEWRNPDAMVELMRKIAECEGVGKILGNGEDYAADYFGRGHEYKTTIGGMEAGLHDPRSPVQTGYSRIYQDPAPGRHTKGGSLECVWDAEDRGQQDLEVYAQTTYDNATGFCIFAGFTFMDRYAAWSSVLGEEISHEEWLDTARRIYILRHAFNLREGVNAHADYKIPAKLRKILKEGPNANVEINPEAMAKKFYEQIGLDPETGMPTRENLEKLGGMEIVIEQLGL